MEWSACIFVLDTTATCLRRSQGGTFIPIGHRRTQSAPSRSPRRLAPLTTQIPSIAFPIFHNTSRQHTRMRQHRRNHLPDDTETDIIISSLKNNACLRSVSKSPNGSRVEDQEAPPDQYEDLSRGMHRERQSHRERGLRESSRRGKSAHLRD
ncbi:hypothetical protein BDV95DRAFT_582015 [Massariosphaeria phaeospora]|uniref:Uncharacterized protein n=1 Tax=Massariosphaeria phaeospora TaxID=100035 RepID=A0A7C8I0H2_9PLEO|nr:hypothetical protein BDV95DRAFT_582015 [Massariosphaeria phaeospora]